MVTERGGCQNEDAPDTAAEQEFGEDESSFNGLAESDVVRDQEAHAGHAQGFQERDELEVLDANAAVEGAGDWFLVLLPAAAVEAEVGGERCPAGGAEESVEIRRRHGVGRVWVGEGGRLEKRLAGFEFPEEALGGGGAAVLVVQMDEVEAACLAVERVDGGDGAAAVADGGQHAGAGDGVPFCRGLGHVVTRIQIASSVVLLTGHGQAPCTVTGIESESGGCERLARADSACGPLSSRRQTIRACLSAKISRKRGNR